jgi:hypothetical protein
MPSHPLRLDSSVDRFVRDVTADEISKEMAEPVWRELIVRRLHLSYRPPPVFAHEVPLEIIPTADIDLVLLDADEIEPLTLTRG